MKPIFSGQTARLLLPLFFLLNTLTTIHATTIYSKQSGSWSSGSTWQGGQVPKAGDYVIIQSNHTVTNSNPFTTNGFWEIRGTLVLSGNNGRSLDASSSLEVDGTLRVEGGSNTFDCITFGSGTIRITAGSTYFDKYHVQNTELLGGLIYFYGPLDLDFPNLTLKNARMDGSQDMTVSTHMSWGNEGILDQGSKLIIAAGATLDFDAGGTFKQSGDLYNWGTVNCSYGTLKSYNSKGSIGNNGTWQFNTAAGKTFTFDFQHFVQNEKCWKQGGGGVTFINNSEFYQSSSSSELVVQQGTFTFEETGSLGLLGLWRVDAGCTLNITPGSGEHHVYYDGPKVINNGLIKGTNWIMAGSDDATLEGNGQYEQLEMKKSGGANVFLAGSPEITKAFNLHGGLLKLNQYDLRLGAVSMDIDDGFESFVETNGTGACVRTCNPNDLVIFPVGYITFAPFVVSLKSNSVKDVMKIRVNGSFYGENTAAGAPLCSEEIPQGVVAHTWFISGQVAGNMADGVAYWTAAAQRNGFDPTNCTLGRYSNNNWQYQDFGPALYSSMYVLQRYNFPANGIFGVFDEAHEQDVNLKQPDPAGNTPVCEWQDLQLHANTSPNAEVSWSGPNGFQSNVHDPMISAIQLSQGGTYVASATQYGCPAQQGVLQVTVNAEPTPSVIGPTHLQPGEQATLTAYGGVSFAWSTGDTTQAINVAPLQTTDYVVTVTNPSGCTATALHTVQVSGASATQEAPNAIQAMQVMPNPVVSTARLSFESMETGMAELSVGDMSGAVLYKQSLRLTKGVNHIDLPFEQAPAGVYRVSVIKDNEVKTIRVLKTMQD